MNEVLIKRFVKLIAKHTGLLVRPQDWNDLNKKLLLRLNALKLSSLEKYYQLLEEQIVEKQLNHLIDHNQLREKHDNQNIQGKTEWKQLLQLLTTGESYFFRDSGQFFLLKNIIFPELIAHQHRVWQQQSQDQPTLRIWSAGCSTGEEPYSLAILLTEMIPDWQNWRLLILGTDINTESIKKAQAGLYGNWSFRTVDEGKKTAYFKLEKNQWRIQDSIRQLVKFDHGNLVQDNFPDHSREIFNIDLIICRNVFVYFESPAIAQVLHKFYHTLRPGGYLLTAHAELYGQELDLFSSQVFPQSVIYQRRQKVTNKQNLLFTVDDTEERNPDGSNFLYSSKFEALDLEASHKPRRDNRSIAQSPSTKYEDNFLLNPLPPKLDSFKSASMATDRSLSNNLPIQGQLQEIKELFYDHKYQNVIQVARQLIQSEKQNYELYYFLAKSLANLGDYRESEKYCYQAIKFNYNWIEPYYLLAEIAQEKGEIDQVKSIFKKIIYLDSSSIHAYLHLAEIYEIEGNLIRAKKMRYNVITMLEKMPKNTLLAREGDQIRAGELLCYIKKLIED